MNVLSKFILAGKRRRREGKIDEPVEAGRK
jgi:hypothetical protein